MYTRPSLVPGSSPGVFISVHMLTQLRKAKSLVRGGYIHITFAVHLLATDYIVTTKIIISPYKIVYLDSKTIVTATMHGCNYNLHCLFFLQVLILLIL